MKLSLVWATIDTLMACILFINLIALLKLYKYVFLNYEWQLKNGIEQLIFERDIDIVNIDLKNYKNIEEKKLWN